MQELSLKAQLVAEQVARSNAEFLLKLERNEKRMWRGLAVIAATCCFACSIFYGR